MTVTFHSYDQNFVDAIRAGGPDANGQQAELTVSTGSGTPCRSCLHNVPKGAGMLVLAARPFPKLQPYAETGPIFFCEDTCAPWPGDGLPPILSTSPDYLLKAYSTDNRIIYGTGQITQAEQVKDYAATLLSDPQVAYVDVRSARNNCFLTRITTTI
mgnify:CR=1 FL=1